MTCRLLTCTNNVLLPVVSVSHAWPDTSITSFARTQPPIYELRTNGCYHYGVLRRLPGSACARCTGTLMTWLGPLFLPSAASTRYSPQRSQASSACARSGAGLCRVCREPAGCLMRRLHCAPQLAATRDSFSWAFVATKEQRSATNYDKSRSINLCWGRLWCARCPWTPCSVVRARYAPRCTGAGVCVCRYGVRGTGVSTYVQVLYGQQCMRCAVGPKHRVQCPALVLIPKPNGFAACVWVQVLLACQDI